MTTKIRLSRLVAVAVAVAVADNYTDLFLPGQERQYTKLEVDSLAEYRCRSGSVAWWAQRGSGGLPRGGPPRRPREGR